MPEKWTERKGQEVAREYAHCFRDDGRLAQQLATDIAAALRSAYEQGQRDAAT